MLLMMPPSSSAGLNAGVATGPRLLLADHHQRIVEACRALRASARAQHPPALIDRYLVLERAVLEHLEAEEAVLLPGYAAYAPEDACSIHEEHAEIRRLLLEIAVEVGLEVVRFDTLEGLIDRLQAHAAHEGAAMYPWAQVHLTPSMQRRLFLRLVRSLRELAGIRPLPAT